MPESDRLWASLRLDNQPKAVRRALPPILHRKTPHRSAGRSRVTHREIIILVELCGQCEPKRRGIQVVIGSLNEELPPHGSELLVGVDCLSKGSAAAQIRVGAAFILKLPVPIKPYLKSYIGKDYR